jgi:hypothetical protein
MKRLYQFVESIFLYLDSRLVILFVVYAAIVCSVTFSYWKKYDWNPSSMVNFGREFALQNESQTPQKAIIFLGEEGDLGAGYDGQIFYYFSRSLSNFGLDWPKGFDESYRAPRIGYPFLVSIFGIFGPWGSIFSMYFWNFVLLIVSFFALRSLLLPEHRHLAILYLFNPFALGSYYVLVSDSVMVSLVVIAYYLFKKERLIGFILTSSLAILTKEPALFFLFPLGLRSLVNRDVKKILLIVSTLIIPIAWHLYLSYKFPNWRAARLTEFILPFEGMIRYFESIFYSFQEHMDLKSIARLLSRLPLVFLFFMGSFLVFSGRLQKGWEFRICILLTMFMIGTAGFYHFWSVYENVSRMFTISIPALILLANEDEQVWKKEYILLTIGLLFLFLVKAILITKTMTYQIGL